MNASTILRILTYLCGLGVVACLIAAIIFTQDWWWLKLIGIAFVLVFTSAALSSAADSAQKRL